MIILLRGPDGTQRAITVKISDAIRFIRLKPASGSSTFEWIFWFVWGTYALWLLMR